MRPDGRSALVVQGAEAGEERARKGRRDEHPRVLRTHMMISARSRRAMYICTTASWGGALPAVPGRASASASLSAISTCRASALDTPTRSLQASGSRPVKSLPCTIAHWLLSQSRLQLSSVYTPASHVVGERMALVEHSESLTSLIFMTMWPHILHHCKRGRISWTVCEMRLMTVGRK